MARTTEREHGGYKPEETATADPPYASFSSGRKACITLGVSAAAFLPPVSSHISFPALTLLAAALVVADTSLNVTLTAFLVMHGQLHDWNRYR